MTKIKICGIMTKEHGLAAAEAGADYLGFVFAKSKRQISPIVAKEIIAALPNTVKIVGVFVDETMENMIEIATYCGLDLLQLHGSEDESSYASSLFPIVKSVSIKSDTVLSDMMLPPSDYVLFDTWHKKMAGGSGQVFNWSLLQAVGIKKPFFLAGGLSAENVKEAIELTRPFAVDVSSGVETNGVKDIEKINTFIQRVKECK